MRMQPHKSRGARIHTKPAKLLGQFPALFRDKFYKFPAMETIGYQSSLCNEMGCIFFRWNFYKELTMEANKNYGNYKGRVGVSVLLTLSPLASDLTRPGSCAGSLEHSLLSLSTNSS